MAKVPTRRRRSRFSRLLIALCLVLALAPTGPTPAEATNLLQNGRMEQFREYARDPVYNEPLTVANGWNIFVESGNPYFMDNVQFAWSPWGTGWVEGYEGEHQQMIFTPEGPRAFVAGLYQQVSGLTPGVAYAFSGRILALSSTAPVGRKLGMDPYGGTDPRSPNVIWGWESWATSSSAFQNAYMAEIARASTVTVFIRVDNPVSNAYNSETWLDAYILDPAPIAHTSALPSISSSRNVPVNWGLDWKPPETSFDWPSAWYQVQAKSGGAWSDWQLKTPATSATFSGQDCQTYSFRSRAIVMHPVLNEEGEETNVGSRLPSYWPPEGQASTTILTSPPSSAVAALPAYHKGPATVSWQGSPGSCGITGYDVQFRDGPSGAWTNWLTAFTGTSAAFAGQNGHTYYLRSAARGAGGYIEPYPGGHDASTTFDMTPPVASVGALPGVMSIATFPVSWSATDSGSGVASFDVQTRSLRLSDDLDSGWHPWLTGTASSSASFSGQDGRRYSFRVTARDALGNVSAPVETVTNLLVSPAPVLATSAKITDPAYPQPGDDLTYVIGLFNTGNLSAGVEIEDRIPVGYGELLAGTIRSSTGTPELDDGVISWEGTVGAGSWAGITYTLRLSDTLPLGTYITNQVTISDGVHATFTRTLVTLVGYLARLPVTGRQ